MSTDTAEVQQQQFDQHRAARVAMFAVNHMCIEHQAALNSVPGAVSSRAIVEAALGYLIGQGLITVTPDDQFPEWLSMDIPDHLYPDIAGMTEANRQMQRAIFPNGLTR